MTVPRRLAELGIELPPVVPPVACYVPAARTGDLVFTAGQVPMVGGVLAGTGKVGAEVALAEAVGYARICALNALAAVADLVGVAAIRRVVKVVGYVASAPGFASQPQVVDGASKLLEEIFGEHHRHARSAVGVSELPLNAPVEIEFVVEVQPL